MVIDEPTFRPDLLGAWFQAFREIFTLVSSVTVPARIAAKAT